MIRVKQLPEHPRYGVSLYCVECGETYSATRGDYFLANPETVMRCCRRALRLVSQHVRTVDVSLTEAEA